MAKRGRTGNHLKNTGLYSGGNWPEYRYGKVEPRPVYNPAKASRARVIKDKALKREVVAQTAATLRTWETTPFQFEAACRHGLRQSFCEKGHGWQPSDDAAADIVAEALANNGAKRPSYDEGQWEYTVSPDFCVGCQGPLDEVAIVRRQRFCSIECAKVTNERRAYGEMRRNLEVARIAQRMIRAEKEPAVECQHCHRPFQRMAITHALARGAGKFCSKACHDASMRIYADRDCVVCGDTFRPSREMQQCCSVQCRAQQQIKPDNAECQHCHKSFKSYRVGTGKQEKFCSTACFHASKSSRVLHKECEWCGDQYVAKGEKGRFCTPSCQSTANDYSKGIVPQRLSAKVFDHYVTMPINAARPAWLTPERFDELVAA